MREERKLQSVQWHYVKWGVWVANGTLLAAAVFLWLLELMLKGKPALIQWLKTNLGFPYPLLPEGNWLIWSGGIACLAATTLGMIIGYVNGNLLKKRLHTLHFAAMNVERGLLSYRVPDLGDDEVGELAWQFNRLAAKWEEQIASLQRLSNQNAALSEQLKQTAIVQERQRLARELHDAVSQQLFAISMTTAAIKRLLERNPEKAEQQIQLVEEMAAAAQAEMRALLLHLRPATLQNKSLKEAIEELLEELRQKHPLHITWEVEHIRLPSGVEDHLFRILQEALSNALRHARATAIEVKLFTHQEQVRLRVADNGTGFTMDEEKMTSYGLTSMNERVTELGGKLEIYSAQGIGTQIEVLIPLVSNLEERGDTDDDSSHVGG